MRCCRRSTTCLASLALLLVLEAGVGSAAKPVGGQPAVLEESAIRHAVEQAVKARMGADAAVRIEALRWQTVPGDDTMQLAASPEPGARLGRPTRFTLTRVSPAPGTGGLGRRLATPAGYAIASVFVAVEHVRAGRAVERGEVCGDEDLADSTGEVGALPIQRLPRRAEAVGGRAVRDLLASEVMTRAILSVRPFVRSGDVVAVRAIVDGVLVLGQAIAEQSGGQGDLVRVVNRDSRRTLKTRVVGRGEVEVVQ